ncbi:MAG: lipoxygenase family protein [Bacteroidota bacterium]
MANSIKSFFKNLFGGLFGGNDDDEKHFRVRKLPIRLFGFREMPAVPLIIRELPGTLLKLSSREKELAQAKNALTSVYTIGNHTENAYSFMYGHKGSTEAEEAREKLRNTLDGPGGKVRFLTDVIVKKHLEEPDSLEVKEDIHPLTTLSLDSPDQYGMSWTNYFNLHEEFTKQFLPQFAATLTDADAATNAFFPFIAEYGLAYNLLFTQKITGEKAAKYKSLLGANWTAEMDGLAAAGHLYAIDLTLFESFEPQQVRGLTRFTPSTLTFLQQDVATKDLKPFAIQVAGANGSSQQFYHRGKATDSAWLYALQAAKTSVTVYGIWIGHVYHWHIVTAAMQMTMFNNLSEDHPIYDLLGPQSKYLIAFDDVLLFLWKHTAPPTSIAKGSQFLHLCNNFATDRQFFEDDPKTAIAELGISQEDFTTDPAQPWNKYRLVGYLLDVWEASEKYVTVFVNQSYSDDQKVANDPELKNWMTASADEDEGNIRGLPPMNSRANLIRVLTSLVYRISVHGCSRMNHAANPGLTFVGNFPPTLQKTDIPSPNATLDTKALLEYLPKTGTIGLMINFYFTFIYSAPYEPLIPIGGVGDNLFFKDEKINQALIAFRKSMVKLIEEFDKRSPTLHQWPLSIET